MSEIRLSPTSRRHLRQLRRDAGRVDRAANVAAAAVIMAGPRDEPEAWEDLATLARAADDLARRLRTAEFRATPRGMRVRASAGVPLS